MQDINTNEEFRRNLVHLLGNLERCQSAPSDPILLKPVVIGEPFLSVLTLWSRASPGLLSRPQIPLVIIVRAVQPRLVPIGVAFRPNRLSFVVRRDLRGGEIG